MIYVARPGEDPKGIARRVRGQRVWRHRLGGKFPYRGPVLAFPFYQRAARPTYDAPLIRRIQEKREAARLRARGLPVPPMEESAAAYADRETYPGGTVALEPSRAIEVLMDPEADSPAWPWPATALVPGAPASAFEIPDDLSGLAQIFPQARFAAFQASTGGGKIMGAGSKILDLYLQARGAKKAQDIELEARRRALAPSPAAAAPMWTGMNLGGFLPIGLGLAALALIAIPTRRTARRRR